MLPQVPPPALPPACPGLRLVGGFDELLSTPFANGVNALCWPRTLPGDFGEVVAQLGPGHCIETLDDARLQALTLSAAGREARDILLEDQARLRRAGLEPVLDCIHDAPRAEPGALIATDVFSFHADSAPVPADTWLCSYHVSATEALRNEEAHRRVDDPATRAALLRQFGGEDGPEFQEYLAENCFDLHYAPLPHARPFSFGLGNLWRIAIAYPGSPVPPCIHRAPATMPGQPPRLLLLS